MRMLARIVEAHADPLRVYRRHLTPDPVALGNADQQHAADFHARLEHRRNMRCILPSPRDHHRRLSTGEVISQSIDLVAKIGSDPLYPAAHYLSG